MYWFSLETAGFVSNESQRVPSPETSRRCVHSILQQIPIAKCRSVGRGSEFVDTFVRNRLLHAFSDGNLLQNTICSKHSSIFDRQTDRPTDRPDRPNSYPGKQVGISVCVCARDTETAKQIKNIPGTRGTRLSFKKCFKKHS